MSIFPSETAFLEIARRQPSSPMGNLPAYSTEVALWASLYNRLSEKQ